VARLKARTIKISDAEDKLLLALARLEGRSPSAVLRAVFVDRFAVGPRRDAPEQPAVELESAE
jgi:hypothetical protein